MFLCPICKIQYEKLISLSLHYRKGHKKTAKDLYVDFYLNGIEPTCKCGCGQFTKFLDITRGFSEYIHGHAAKVPGKNNWGNNKKAQEKSIEIRRRLFKNNELRVWNEGLTKEIDARIAKIAQTQSVNFLNNPEKIKKYSNQMKENRLNGTVPTLYGPNHSQWKGGISKLSTYCHGNKQLYDNWKFPKLQSVNFRCEQCKVNGSLHVHHNKIRMATIIQLIIEDLGLLNSNFEDESVKSNIANKVAEYHVKNNVSAIVLCESCHMKEHTNLNFAKLM